MSVIKVGAIQNQSGVEVYTAKAWINFDGTLTISIRGSGNIASIVDNGTGIYTINYSNQMIDQNYSIATNAKIQSAPTRMPQLQDGPSNLTTASVAIETLNVNAVRTDVAYAGIEVFR